MSIPQTNLYRTIPQHRPMLEAANKKCKIVQVATSTFAVIASFFLLEPNLAMLFTGAVVVFNLLTFLGGSSRDTPIGGSSSNTPERRSWTRRVYNWFPSPTPRSNYGRKAPHVTPGRPSIPTAPRISHIPNQGSRAPHVRSARPLVPNGLKAPHVSNQGSRPVHVTPGRPSIPTAPRFPRIPNQDSRPVHVIPGRPNPASTNPNPVNRRVHVKPGGGLSIDQH